MLRFLLAAVTLLAPVQLFASAFPFTWDSTISVAELQTPNASLGESAFAGDHYFVTWCDNGVHVRRLEDHEGAQWAAVAIPSGSGAQSPAIAVNGGAALLVWMEPAQGTLLLRAMHVDAFGNPGSAEPFAIDDASPAAAPPRLFWNGQEFVVLWISEGRVLSARIEAGSRIVTNVTPVADAPGATWLAMAATQTTLALAWQSSTFPEGCADGCAPVSERIVGLLASLDAHALTPPFPISPDGGRHEQPALATDGTTFLAAWRDGENGVSAATVAADGTVSAPVSVAAGVPPPDAAGSGSSSSQRWLHALTGRASQPADVEGPIMAISYSSEWIVGWIARAGDATEAQFRRLLPGLEPVDATPFPSPALTFGDQPTVQATMTEDFSGGLLAWRGVDPHTGAVTLETTLFEPGGLSYFFGGDATLTAERPSDHVAAGGLLTYQFHVTPRDMYPLLSVGAEGFTVESASVNGQPCRIGTRVVCYPGATPQVPFTATIVLRALPVPEGRVTAWLFAIDLNPADNSIDERVTVDAPRGRAIRR